MQKQYAQNAESYVLKMLNMRKCHAQNIERYTEMLLKMEKCYAQNAESYVQNAETLCSNCFCILSITFLQFEHTVSAFRDISVYCVCMMACMLVYYKCMVIQDSACMI